MKHILLALFFYQACISLAEVPAAVQAVSAEPVVAELPAQNTAITQAQDVKPTAARPVVHQTDTLSAVLKMLLGLAVVVGLILGLARLARWLGQGSMLSGQAVQLVSVLPLGAKEKLALVDVGGKQVLIGVTAHSISALLELPEPVTLQKPSQTTAAEKGPSKSQLSAKSAAEFSKKLHEFLNAGQRNK
jgi:flagellar protein FliO/FliZ